MTYGGDERIRDGANRDKVANLRSRRQLKIVRKYCGPVQCRPQGTRVLPETEGIKYSKVVERDAVISGRFNGARETNCLGPSIRRRRSKWSISRQVAKLVATRAVLRGCSRHDKPVDAGMRCGSDEPCGEFYVHDPEYVERRLLRTHPRSSEVYYDIDFPRGAERRTQVRNGPAERLSANEDHIASSSEERSMDVRPKKP